MRNIIYFIIVLISFFSHSQSIDELKYFNKVDIVLKKDTVTFIHSTFNEKPKPTIIFIQGSLPYPIILKENNLKWANFPFDYVYFIKEVNLVIINRKGVNLEADFNHLQKIQNSPTLEYLKNDNLYYRVFQVEEVLKFLKKQKWVDKDKLFLVGHSEGYRVAAKVAERNQNIKKIACLAADPINRISETITRLQVENTKMENDSARITKIYKELKDYKNLQKFNKNDYDMKNFISYNQNPPFKSFEKFKNPVLVCYGTNDVRAYNNNILPFLINKDNLELKIYPDLDHNFIKKEFENNGKSSEDSFHWNKVFKDVVDWLLK